MKPVGIVLVTALSLGALLIGVKLRRRQGDSWRRASILVLVHAILGVCVIAPGFLLEPALWFLFNDGIIGMWEYLGSSATGSTSIRSAVLWGLLPGVVTGVIAVSARGVSNRIALSILAAVGLLAIEDAYIGPIAREQFVFSLLSDVIGGGIAGAAIGWLSTLSMRTLEAEPTRAPTVISQGVALGVTLLAIPAGLFLLYFFVFYQLPVPVIVDLQAWKRLTFDYVGPTLGRIADPMLPVTATGMGSGFFKDNAEITWQPSAANDRGTRVSLRLMLPKWDKTPPADGGVISFKSLIALSRPVHAASIGAGTIRITGNNFFLTVQPDVATPIQGLLVIRNLLGLLLSRDARDQLTVSFPGTPLGRDNSWLAPGVFPDRPKLLMVSGLSGSQLILADLRRLAVIVTRTSLARVLSDAAHDKLTIALSDGTTYDFSAATVPKTESFAVMILLGGDRDRRASLSLPLKEHFLCAECDVMFRAFNLATPTVGQLRIEGAKGSVELALTSHPMNEGSELYLGGRRITITQQDKSVLRITGRASPVVLNGVLLSQTVWSSLPNEVKAAIIVGAFGTLTLPLLRRMWLGFRRSPPAR